MTNIYNKKVLVRNGTLISNWYEEQVLRDATGEGRTIPRDHLPKKALDFEAETVKMRPQDDTKTRILGQQLKANLVPFSKDYGNFPKDTKQQLAIKDKIFLDFFKSYLNQGSRENIGKQQERGSSSELNTFTSTFSNSSNKNNFVDPKIDKFIPFYQNKEMEYWDTNLHRTNKDYKPVLQVEDNLKRAMEKICAGCRKKGWLGMRNLKNYFKATFKKTKIPKFNFKYLLTNFGIFLNDQEITSIYSVYDPNNKDEIVWEKYIQDIIIISEERLQLINQFLNQINDNQDFMKNIESIFSPHAHPDLLEFRKSTQEIKTDFSSVLGSLNEGGSISADSFGSLLKDIAYSLEKDNDFFGVLVCW